MEWILFRCDFYTGSILVNWDVEQQIWDRVFGKDALNVSFADTRIIMTDTIYSVPAIHDFSDEILFEQYGFHSVVKTSGRSFCRTNRNILILKTRFNSVSSGCKSEKFFDILLSFLCIVEL